MAATPILTQTTTVSYNSQTVAGVQSISGISSGSATEIDVTTLASTAKEFKMGLRDNGTFQMVMIRNQDDLGQLELWNAQSSQTAYTMVITLPTSTANVLTFSAFVQSFSTDIAADGVVTGTATIRITGGIVYS